MILPFKLNPGDPFEDSSVEVDGVVVIWFPSALNWNSNRKPIVELANVSFA